MKVCVFRYEHPRSKRLAESLDIGVLKMGWKLDRADNRDHVMASDADVLASYGWVNKPIFDHFTKTGRTFLYLDLGYWERKNGMGDYSGYHKVVVNARHANAYFQRERPGDRLEDAPPIEPWKSGGSHIVLAGMSRKAAAAADFLYLDWERKTIAALRKITDRPIMYRSKPSDKQARPINGSGMLFSSNAETINDALRNAYGLVTLHSNASIDAMAAGVPFFASEGLGASVSCASLADLINKPRRDMDREAFLRQVSYVQWRRSEIEDGSMFSHMITDGLLPC